MSKHIRKIWPKVSVEDRDQGDGREDPTEYSAGHLQDQEGGNDSENQIPCAGYTGIHHDPVVIEGGVSADDNAQNHPNEVHDRETVFGRSIRGGVEEKGQDHRKPDVDTALNEIWEGPEKTSVK